MRITPLQQFELHIDINQPILPVELIAQRCSLSNAVIKQSIQKGALWLTQGKSTQRLRRIKKLLPSHSTLHFYYDENVLAQHPTAPTKIADFQQYSIWYKPYGMLSQGSKWSDHCTINRWIESNDTPTRPCFIVHRLDRAASGLMIIAHSKKMAQTFAHLFEQHSKEISENVQHKPLYFFEKKYQIIVHGDFSTQHTPLVINEPIENKMALSEFSFIEFNKETNQSLLSVIIKTGRKHQIRRHAAFIGFPVVGDRLYGEKTIHEVNLQLCAVNLQFNCPVTQQRQCITLPETLQLNVK
jgi:tRNA pseudouridine32 synthase/23S rRNA pseudouridine746 synthase